MTSVPIRIALFAGAVAAAAALIAASPSWNPRLMVGVMAAAAATCLAVTLVAWTRYRSSRDPQALLLAVAFGALTVQLAFGIWWNLRLEPSGATDGTAFENYDPTGASFRSATFFALQSGWSVVALCGILAVPWWDRRGRPPLRWTVVSGTVAVVIIVVDWVAAAAAPTTPPHADMTHLGYLGPELAPPSQDDLGIAGLAITTLAIVLLAVACWRHFSTPRRSPVYRWTGVALLLTIPWIAAAYDDPGIGLGYVQPADAILILVPLVALGGLLAAQRTEASHQRRATDRAEEVLGGRAEIASMVAHDVRGPVGSIASLATTTRTSYDRLDDAQRLEFVAMIESEAGRLLRLVDQIALALKVDAGTLEARRTRQRLAPLVQRSVDDVDTERHVLSVRTDDDVVATVDGRWFSEAIRQGIDNAVRFSPDGSAIAIVLREEGGQAVVEIEDQGPGVPQEQRDAVFERFARWRPKGYEDRSGSGLGLFICRAIVREHGGEATLEAGPNGGTILRVRL